MCTVARIFINGRTLHIKRLFGKFKQRTNMPFPYHYKKAYRTRTIRKKAYRTSQQKLRRTVPYLRTVL